MDPKSKKEPNGTKENGNSAVAATPTSIAIAKRGISTSLDVKQLTSALACDVVNGLVPAASANASCNAIGKLLKVVELEYKYGRQSESGERSLALTSGDPNAC
jgi:hypothetical protein